MPAVGYSIQSVSISSGGTVSGQFQRARNGNIGVWVPVLTSCSLFVAAAPTSGGTFTRLHTSAGTGIYGALVGAGSLTLTVPVGVVGPWTYLRLETSAAQADARNFQVVVKL